MPRSRVSALLDAYNQLNEVEQKVFLDLVDPQPEPEAPAKQTRKKRGPRSARAESLSNAIAKAPKAGLPCAHILSDNNHCTELEDNPIHDPTMGYRDYHEFEAPKVKKAAK